MIVDAQPAGGKFLNFAERFGQVMGEPVETNRPVVVLNAGILF